jgi:Helicase C-terminal domain
MSLPQSILASYSHFAVKPFRVGQEEAVKKILQSDKKVIVVVAPTGSGKSVIGMVAGACRGRFCYLVSSKNLQAQIIHDFPEAKAMMGRSNYPCMMWAHRQCDDCVHTREAPCPVKATKCVYELEKQATILSPKQILNYHYFLTEANYIGKFSNYPTIICDEGDILESMIAGVVSVEFGTRFLNRHNIPSPRYKTFGPSPSLQHWKDWIGDALVTLANEIGQIRESLKNPPTIQDQLTMTKSISGLQAMSSRFQLVQTHIDASWVIETRPGHNETRWALKPSWLTSDITNAYLFRHAKEGKFVLMSATFPVREVLAEMLGVEQSDIEYFEVDSTFPIVNRPVFLTYSCNLRTDKTLKSVDPGEIVKLQEAVKKILAMYPTVSGIIHTVNWKLNEAVMGLNDPRLITHEADDKQAQLNIFLRSNANLVWVSPSSTRGLDLPDSLARFNIIAKAPYLNLGDKMVNMRVFGRRSIGEYWYKSACAQEIVQAAGRVVRHQADWGHTFILDTQGCELVTDHKGLFPKYFKEAVQVINL